MRESSRATGRSSSCSSGQSETGYRNLICTPYFAHTHASHSTHNFTLKTNAALSVVTKRPRTSALAPLRSSFILRSCCFSGTHIFPPSPSHRLHYTIVLSAFAFHRQSRDPPLRRQPLHSITTHTQHTTAELAAPFSNRGTGTAPTARPSRAPSSTRRSISRSTRACAPTSTSSLSRPAYRRQSWSRRAGRAARTTR